LSTFWIIIGIGTLFYIFTCWAIIHIALRDFGSFEKKVKWGVIAMVPFIGPLIYFFLGRKQGEKRKPDLKEKEGETDVKRV